MDYSQITFDILRRLWYHMLEAVCAKESKALVAFSKYYSK